MQHIISFLRLTILCESMGVVSLTFRELYLQNMQCNATFMVTLPPCLSYATEIITSATLPPWLTYEIHTQIPDEGDGWGWVEQKWLQPRLQPVIVTSLWHVTHTPKTDLGHLWGPHWPYESTRDGLAAQANSRHTWNRSRKCTRLVHKFIVNQQSLH